MSSTPETAPDWSNVFDRTRAGVYERREADWRNGAVVYQVIVDRFAPSADLDAKRHLYPAPKRLRSWDELPERGLYLEQERLHSHEIDFWGGDLAATRAHLDHVQGLGVDVLYLNPIHLAYTNHGYDALDHTQVSPWLGTREEVTALAADLHGRGMRLVLDGVFNHMGRNAPVFRAAEADPTSPYRAWFDLDERYPGGVRAWAGAQNLPELVLEHPEVRDHVYRSHDSVVRGYLRDGVDGWRLDVAHDIGFRYLTELTLAAHTEKPGSLVLGEVASYPREWFPALDGILHWALREVLLAVAGGLVAPAHGQRMLERTYADADLEHMLRSWIYLDNHDTARLATTLPDERRRLLATVLQLTLPGSPNLYYGSEVAMTGNEDPQMRAPMRWDRVEAGDRWLDVTRHLLGIRRERRALRVGDLRWLVTDRLIGYQRHTDVAADSVLVLVNPADHAVSEEVLVPDTKLMDGTRMLDLLGGPDLRLHRSLLHVELPAHGALVLAPVVAPEDGYSPYKRVR